MNLWEFRESPRPYMRAVSVDCDASNEAMVRFLLRLVDMLEEWEDTTLLSVTTKSSEFGEDCWHVEAMVEGPTVDAFLEEVLTEDR